MRIEGQCQKEFYKNGIHYIRDFEVRANLGLLEMVSLEIFEDFIKISSPR